MTTLREAAQQALEALKDDQYRMVGTAEGHWKYKTDLAIAALEAALAQQAEPTRSQKMADAGFTRRPSLWSLQARKALELIAAPQRPDGTWNRDREACRQLAAEALGRYDDD